MVTITDSKTLKKVLETGQAGLVRAGSYKLAKAKAKHGASLTCEPGAVIDGNGADMIVFLGGGKLHITGGVWKNCKRVVWQQGGSFIYCRFREMVIHRCTEAFRIGISIGCVWADCDVAIGQNAIVWSGEHQSNANSVMRLVAQRLTGYAVRGMGNGNHGQVNNKIQACTIHNGGGLVHASLARNLIVECCYVEGMTAADIKLEDCHSTTVRENWFAPTPDTVKERVEVSGNGGADVVRNTFVLARAKRGIQPQVGVRVLHNSPWRTVISRNYIQTGGVRLPYADRIAAGANYDMSPYIGSGGVS